MRYNDLPEEGREEVKQLIKAQFFDNIGEHATDHLLDNVMAQFNYDITLYIDFKKIENVVTAMDELEYENMQNAEGDHMKNDGERDNSDYTGAHGSNDDNSI